LLYLLILENFIKQEADYHAMPRVMLFTMNNCETCDEMKARLSGRPDVDIINLDEELDRAKEIIKEIKRQGDISFEDFPQCVLKDKGGKFHLCDTEHMEQVLEEVAKDPE